jgi:hypothetical protein
MAEAMSETDALTKLADNWTYGWAGESRADTIANVEKIAKAALAAPSPKRNYEALGITEPDGPNDAPPRALAAPSPGPFAVGDIVEKIGGDYTFQGVVRMTGTKASGAWRCVVEDDRGVLHVFSEKNLRKAAPSPTQQLIECDQCSGSGFDTPGTGYGNVCGKCGGQKYFPAPAAKGGEWQEAIEKAAEEVACARFYEGPGCDNVGHMIAQIEKNVRALAAAPAATPDAREHPPTQWAYDQACKALHAHRARADAAEARVAQLEVEKATLQQHWGTEQHSKEWHFAQERIYFQRSRELEEALRDCQNWLRRNANAESKLCREQLNRRKDKYDAFVEAHNAIAGIVRAALAAKDKQEGDNA